MVVVAVVVGVGVGVGVCDDGGVDCSGNEGVMEMMVMTVVVW